MWRIFAWLYSGTLQLIENEPKLQIPSIKTKYLVPLWFAGIVNESPVEHLPISWDITFISTLWHNFRFRLSTFPRCIFHLSSRIQNNQQSHQIWIFWEVNLTTYAILQIFIRIKFSEWTLPAASCGVSRRLRCTTPIIRIFLICSSSHAPRSGEFRVKNASYHNWEFLWLSVTCGWDYNA